MRGSSAPSARASRVAVTLDLALCTSRDRQLAVLLTRVRSRWMLPHLTYRADDALEASAARLAVAAVRRRPAWLEQLGVFGSLRGTAALDVACVGVIAPTYADAGAGYRWFTTGTLPPMSSRHRAIVQAAWGALRERMDHAPVAFGLLSPLFTLSALQAAYELLLGRRLHKASFRRALHAARVVEPAGEWRSEGRGRPAQLFRYAPRRRRAGGRGVRFELLGR